MHIVLVSACEKRAIKRTRAVLDSYAMRSGNRAWLTPITQEGLGELRGMLRKSATRQTSVACFRNDGGAKMTLLWIVGSKRNFDHDGVSPIATQTRKNKSFMPDWARVCATLAGAAGQMHDLGKYGVIFQDKLNNPKPVADDVRHEWISLLLVRQLMEGASWEDAWEKIRAGGNAKRYYNVNPFDGKLSNASD
ncbi:CRISPR-associated helicase Cas3, Yersinia-type, partial [hydrothermal vent metagenome]